MSKNSSFSNNSVNHKYTVCQKHFYFKLFKQLYVTIQLIVNTVLMSKNNSISNNSVKHNHVV